MIGDGDGVVEEGHHSVASKVLERSAVGRKQLSDQLVIGPQHLEVFLGRGGLCEGGEATEVAEEAGDVGAVAREQLLSVVRGDQLGDLRRDEPGKLRALPLDRLECPRVRDRDRGLVGECLDELDMVIRE